MKRDGDMQMRGGRIKERSRGRQQKRREEKERRPEMERVTSRGGGGGGGRCMKMRFSTACDCNYHQRESATESEHAATCAFPRARPRGLHSCVCIRYSCRALLLPARLSAHLYAAATCARARACLRNVHTCACGVLISSTCARRSAFI